MSSQGTGAQSYVFSGITEGESCSFPLIDVDPSGAWVERTALTGVGASE